jgi:hypothetical protein
MSARASLLDQDDRTDEQPPSPSVNAPSLAFLRDSTSPPQNNGDAHYKYTKNGNGGSSSNGHNGSHDHSDSSSHPVAAAPGLASSLSRNSHSAAFRPEKPLGPDVVVLKGVSKRYKLAGREEDVIALRSVDLTPSERPDDLNHIGPIREGEFVMIRGPSGGGSYARNDRCDLPSAVYSSLECFFPSSLQARPPC